MAPSKKAWVLAWFLCLFFLHFNFFITTQAIRRLKSFICILENLMDGRWNLKERESEFWEISSFSSFIHETSRSPHQNCVTESNRQTWIIKNLESISSLAPSFPVNMFVLGGFAKVFKNLRLSFKQTKTEMHWCRHNGNLLHPGLDLPSRSGRHGVRHRRSSLSSSTARNPPEASQPLGAEVLQAPGILWQPSENTAKIGGNWVTQIIRF